MIGSAPLRRRPAARWLRRVVDVLAATAQSLRGVEHVANAPRPSLRLPPTSAPARSRAFTLVEVMAAGAVFLLVVGGVLTSYGMASRQFRVFQEQTQALNVANGVIEDLVLATSASSQLDPTLAHSKTYDAEGNAVAGGAYLATWTIAPDVPIAGMRQITLSVTWTDENAHRIQIVTVRQ